MRLAYATGVHVRSRRLIAETLASVNVGVMPASQRRLRALRKLYRATDIRLPRKTLLWISSRGRSARSPSTTARE